MKNKILTCIAIIALLFAACNSSKDKSNIETPHTLYNSEYCPEQDSLGVEFKANLELPSCNDDTSLTIRKELLHSICGPSYNNESDPQEAMENLYNFINNEWKKCYKPNQEYIMPMLWELKTQCHPIAENEDFINYRTSTYYYAGGAHGLTAINYIVFYKPTAKRLTNNDIYKPNTEKEIDQLLMKAFAQQCAQDSNLANNKISEPILNNNFTITPDSIIYLYNQYDIATYSQGAVEIALHKKTIAPYLNPNSELALYWNIKQ